MSVALALAACAAGCSWIVGVSDDPVVVDVPPEPEAGLEADIIPTDASPIPPNDAATADEDAVADADADADADAGD